MSKIINIKKKGIRCPHCTQEIGKEDINLEYETISLELYKRGQTEDFIYTSDNLL